MATPMAIATEGDESIRFGSVRVRGCPPCPAPYLIRRSFGWKRKSHLAGNIYIYICR